MSAAVLPFPSRIKRIAFHRFAQEHPDMLQAMAEAGIIPLDRYLFQAKATMVETQEHRGRTRSAWDGVASRPSRGGDTPAILSRPAVLPRHGTGKLDGLGQLLRAVLSFGRGE
jgi:hypothetical protein